MTRNITNKMQEKHIIHTLLQEKRALAIQREALILFSLSLGCVLGIILIAI